MKILIIARSLLMNQNFLADTFWGNIFLQVACTGNLWVLSLDHEQCT